MIDVAFNFRTSLTLALDGALKHIESLDTAPVCATADPAALRARLGKALNADSIAADRVIEDLLNDTAGGLIGSASGRFFAWVIGGSLPGALAADWLTSAWDQNAAQFTAAPAAAIVEDIAGTWLKEVLSLPSEASFAFVTGCQMAHATCLASARHALLARQGWDIERDGLYGATPIRILTSAAHHGSVERALRLLGMGSANIVSLPIADDGRLSAETLHGALKENNESPAIVLLQAGDINTGVFDDFETLIPVAKEHGAWVHVDGAFGLWAAANPRTRYLTTGVEAADSWATDGHKMLNVPYDCGYAFVRDAHAHRSAMFSPAPYIPIMADNRDSLAWNPEWSRRARGFATYAALRELGRNGIAALVERCCRNAHAITMGIAALNGAELLWEPTFNQGLVSFGDDATTESVVADVVRGGDAFFSATTWRGRRAMRISVCNWQTSERDADRAINAVANAVQHMWNRTTV